MTAMEQAIERRILSWLPDYDISNFGEIRRISPAITRGSVPYTVKCSLSQQGYILAKLMMPNGTKKFLRVHRLVCEAFHGAPPTSAHQAAHEDGTRTNNNASNLRWATAKENIKDKIKHGRVSFGSRNGRAKLSWDQVREIRNIFTGRRGEVKRLARRYGVGETAIIDVLKGRTWQCQ